MGTILADDPQLDVRLVETTRQPKVVVVDSLLRTPLDAKILAGERPVFIYCAVEDPEKAAALAQRGATVISCPDQQSQAPHRVDLRAMLLDLGKREINELHVEAGHTLNGALIEQGLADEFLIYFAPKLLGTGRDMARLGPLTALTQAVNLEFLSTDRIGPDLRVVARVPGRDDF
jgi:diaminohydroxyphosphoribosylaminopyrimidine deaminase/5-amino-6-(5-phosphoribosylamino)uracil reductase